MEGDTAPIRAEERFDEDRVARYLRRQMGLGDVRIAFAQFPGGKANLTYLVRADGREWVLRRPPLGPVAPGSHDMRREYKVLSVLHRVYPPAPRALHLCEDPSVMGDVFFVMERRRGAVIREAWPPALPDTDDYRRLLAERVVAALADLHLVDYISLGLSDLGHPDGFVERQVAGWTDRWHRAKEDDVPAMEELSVGLAERVPAPQAAVVLHNDFKVDNLMVDADANVVAVFDWDMATLGDPLVDLGTALAYWAGRDDATYPVFGSLGITLAPVMPKEAVTEQYAARSGFSIERIGYYEALGLFRIAVIIQQIYIRYRRGQTSDHRFAVMGAIVAPIAEAALARLG